MNVGSSIPVQSSPLTSSASCLCHLHDKGPGPTTDTFRDATVLSSQIASLNVQIMHSIFSIFEFSFTVEPELLDADSVVAAAVTLQDFLVPNVLAVFLPRL